MAWPDAHLDGIPWVGDELLSNGGRRGAGMRDGGLSWGAVVEALRRASAGAKGIARSWGCLQGFGSSDTTDGVTTNEDENTVRRAGLGNKIRSLVFERGDAYHTAM